MKNYKWIVLVPLFGFNALAYETVEDIATVVDGLNNLADNPEYAEDKKKLREQMKAELIAQGDPRMLRRGDQFDQYPFRGSSFNYETGEKAKTFNMNKGYNKKP